jgi:hypothetical protein
MRRGGVSFIPKKAKRGALDGCQVLAIKGRETLEGGRPFRVWVSGNVSWQGRGTKGERRWLGGAHL